jgi:Ran GTPase-activating protein (RanGAP) involved in mRNA processing and transport
MQNKKKDLASETAMSRRLLQAIERLNANDADLTTLELKNANIRAEGAGMLAQALKANSTLKYVDLKGNNLGDEGVHLIAEALKNNSTLAFLGLGYNNLGPEGTLVERKFVLQQKIIISATIHIVVSQGQGPLLGRLQATLH